MRSEYGFLRSQTRFQSGCAVCCEYCLNGFRICETNPGSIAVDELAQGSSPGAFFIESGKFFHAQITVSFNNGKLSFHLQHVARVDPLNADLFFNAKECNDFVIAR